MDRAGRMRSPRRGRRGLGGFDAPPPRGGLFDPADVCIYCCLYIVSEYGYGDQRLRACCEACISSCGDAHTMDCKQKAGRAEHRSAAKVWHVAHHMEETRGASPEVLHPVALVSGSVGGPLVRRSLSIERRVLGAATSSGSGQRGSSSAAAADIKKDDIKKEELRGSSAAAADIKKEELRKVDRRGLRRRETVA